MRIAVPLALVLALAATAIGGELPRAEPAEVGLDAETLAKIDETVAGMLERKEFPGASVAVARNGKVAYLKAFGDFKVDSLIRIYSMTKPVTVVAALMLVDEGRLKLDDPVSKYIEGFDELRVHGSEKEPTPITVQHLMQHTAGFTYGFLGNTPSDKAYRAKNVLDRDSTLEEMMAKLAGIDLVYEPGSKWRYSVSIDVLGRVVEIVAGQPFDKFLKTRIFEPLGMKDTAFHVPDAKLGRFVPCCGPLSFVIEPVKTSHYRKPPKMLSGGGGLVSTLSDYLTFALMLDAGGTWNGKKILEPGTVTLMTTNQLPESLIPIRFGIFPIAGTGFGLGVSVRVKGGGPGEREGVWGWGGAASTDFFVSPKDRIVVVTMLQRLPTWNALDRAVRPIVFEALREPVTPGPGTEDPQR